MPAYRTIKVTSLTILRGCPRLPLLLSYSVEPNSWPNFHSCCHDDDDLRSSGGKDLLPKRANRGVDHDAHDLLKGKLHLLALEINYHSRSLRLWNGRRCNSWGRLRIMQGDFDNNESRFAAAALVIIFSSLFVKGYLLSRKADFPALIQEYLLNQTAIIWRISQSGNS